MSSANTSPPASNVGISHQPPTITVSLLDLSKMIDHSLLHPTLTSEAVTKGLKLSTEYNVAAACIKPYHIPLAQIHLAETDVMVCPVIGFPHGNSMTQVKVFEASEAVRMGGVGEVDMVVNVGMVLGEEWEHVRDEIGKVNHAVVRGGAVLKVIFENDYLEEKHIIKLCEICTDVGVAFVKTSSGYGFVKQANGDYNYKGATINHLKLMRKHAGKNVQIKAAGGVRTLDDLLRVRALGVTRVGATTTAAILEEAKKRGIGEKRIEVKIDWE